jgi:hypothetical protein
MALQLSVNARNARLDAIETEWGASPILKLRTGVQPASCAAADAGTELATMALPADSMAAAGAGAKAKSGTWEDLAGDAAGIAGHFRIYKNDGVTCVLQGSCGIGTGDMQLDNTSIAVGQKITVTSFTLTDGNA